MKYNSNNNRLIPIKVYVSHNEYTGLKEIAKEQNVSISYVGRKWLTKGITRYNNKQQK